MPTGYTAGILDGEIKTFQQFATLCVRNFGATIHMRDDPMDYPYVERTPSEYNKKSIEEANKLLSDANTLSDQEVIAMRMAELSRDKKYHLEAIEKAKVSSENLNRILEGAKNYNPPTEQHKGIKTFMIEQITSTISHDCNTSYHHEKLAKIDTEIFGMTAANVRASMKERAIRDLKYHEEEYRKDVERCKDSNEWVKKFFESIK